MKKQNSSTLKLRQTKKGFTLIELLMVVAIIAILSTMILITLDSGREKAELNRYTSYGVQMYRLVGDSIAAGYFDGITKNTNVDLSIEYCLGDYPASSSGFCPQNTVVDTALLKMAQEFPKTDTAYSPYNDEQGVAIFFNNDNNVTVKMYLTDSDDDFVDTACVNLNWSVCAGADHSCCSPSLPLNARHE